MAENHQLDLSVVIPSYNYAIFIKTAVNSVINQAYKAKEIIVVDDGSTDDTKAVIKTLQDEHLEHSINYYFQENKGVSAARNYGYKKSMGSYLMFLDADDKLLPKAFEHIDLAIKRHKDAKMIFGGYRGISYSGKVHNRQPVTLSSDKLKNIADVLSGKMIGIRPSSTILKRCVMAQLKFPEKVHVEEDALFFGHVFSKFNCVSIPAILVEMPRHSGSLRENYQRIVETGTHGIDELFEILPDGPDTEAVRENAYVRRYLKISRKACISHDYSVAAQNYMQAFRLKPNSIFNLKHFPRMIKSLFMQFLYRVQLILEWKILTKHK